MSPDRKINLAEYDGPMTMVGYPDFSAPVNQHPEIQVFPNKLLSTANGHHSADRKRHHRKKPR